MIKRKSGVDKNKAFEEACKKNGIILTPKNTNKRPVSYIDRNGRKRFFEPINHSNTSVRRDFNVGDTVRVYKKINNNGMGEVFEGIVLEKQITEKQETFTVRKKLHDGFCDVALDLRSPNLEKLEIVRRGKTRLAKKIEKHIEIKTGLSHPKAKNNEKYVKVRNGVKSING